MLGVRKTIASGDMVLPDKTVLVQSFFKPISEMTEEEKWKRKVMEKLTVGARALTKHAHRSSEVWLIQNRDRDFGEQEWALKRNEIVRRRLC